MVDFLLSANVGPWMDVPKWSVELGDISKMPYLSELLLDFKVD